MTKGSRLGNVNKNQENIHVVPKPIFSHYQSISDSKSENVSFYAVSSAHEMEFVNYLEMLKNITPYSIIWRIKDGNGILWGFVQR